MMGAILGIGVDVVDVHRLQETIERQGDRFVEKIFTSSEVKYCRSRKHPYEHFAARFAAKEAVGKALQTGWSGVFQWKDVEVMNEPSGAPRVMLHNKMAAQLSGQRIHLSLSHTQSTVIAFAVIESI
jgi:holo-[acyl-carrier protein] synthase